MAKGNGRSDSEWREFERELLDLRSFLLAFCRKLAGPQLGEDLAQETLMKALVSKESFIKGSNLKAWLFTIARNRIIDWYRKKKSLSLDSLTEKAGTEGELFKDTKPTHNIEMTYEAKALMEKIQAIDPLYQQAVYFRFIEGLEPKEIAAIIGQSVNVVSVRIHRGIRQLRKLAGYDAQEYGT